MKGYFSVNSFIAGIMFGILLTGAWFFSDSFTPAPSPSSSADTTIEMQEGGSVSVGPQSAGNTAVVESVTVPPPGVWVAVREVVDDELGNVLGAARVKGPRSNVSIPLLRATEPGRTYAIQLYRDDAGGVFDVTTNSIYVDFDTGMRVVTYFTTAE